MSKLAVHIQHFKRGAVGGVATHNWYKRKEKDVHSNQDIDPSRSKENVQLVVPETDLYQDVKALVDGSTGRVTSASIWLSEWIVYPPEDLQDPLTADKEKVVEYFADVREWMQQQGYTIPMAVIHMDESTVHCHFDTVPLTDEGKLSRKEIYTRARLSSIHTELAEHLAAKGWNIQRGDSTEGKQVKAKTVAEYKKDAEKAKAEILEQIQKAKTELAGTRDELTVAQEDLTAAQERVEIEQDVATELQHASQEAAMEVEAAHQEVSALEERRDALKDEIGLLYDKAQDVRQRYAAAVEKADGFREIVGQLDTAVATKELQLKEMTDKLEDVNAEVQIREKAIERLDARGSAQMGDAGWRRSIDQLRGDKAKDEQQGLLAAFAEMLIRRFPDISQLWLDFQRRAKERKPTKGKDGPVI